MTPPYLRPIAPTAPAAILCGDPARALAIAQRVLVEPRMSNHHRGLWGYHGSTATGQELSVQATGIGGPSAALVLDLLAGRGLRRAIRIGSCRSTGRGRQLGSRLVASTVLGRDGASAAYGAEPEGRLAPDPALTKALLERCDGAVELISLDRPAPPSSADDGAVYDLQSAALLAAGAEVGVRVAVALVLSRDADGPLPDEPHEAAALRLADVAADVLDLDSSSR